MSELEKREDFSQYDSMTTEELQEILRKHTHNELETEPDTQELFKIMEVISSRRQNAGFPAFRSDEDAFVEFSEHYMPNEKKTARLNGINRTLRSIAAVLAMVLVLTVGTTLTAKAFRIDIWSRLASWSKEFFRFSDHSQDIIVEEPKKENNLELKSLQDALVKENVKVKVAPRWLPEGYKSEDVNVETSPKGRAFSAVFKKNDERLIINIRQTIGTPANQVEKNDDLLEVYVVDGIEYYIFSNTETLQAAWSIGEFECIIGGVITLEEMKTMINSI